MKIIGAEERRARKKSPSRVRWIELNNAKNTKELR